MSFLLDTDTCSAFIKHHRGLAHRFVQHSGRLHLAAVAAGELYTWAYRRSNPTPTLKAIETELLPHVSVLVFDGKCTQEFGRVSATLLNAGLPLHAVDLQIAATALVQNLTVVTHNTKRLREYHGASN
jgi:tRNA(fMet)-specific endonuclease VapC